MLTNVTEHDATHVDWEAVHKREGNNEATSLYRLQFHKENG